MHKKLIDELDSFANLYGQDTLWAQSAAALRELLKEREEYQKAVTALDESMKHVPVNEQLIKLNIELGTAKLEIRELRAKLEKAEEVIDEAPVQNNCGCNTSGIRETEEWIGRLRAALKEGK